MPALPLVAISYVAGCALAATLSGPWWLTALLATLAAAAFRLRVTPRPALLVLVAAVALAAAGHARYDASAPLPAPLAALDGPHEVIAVAVEDARVTGSVMRVALDTRTVDGAASRGRLRMTAHLDTTSPPFPRSGDLVALSGTLRPVPAPQAAFIRADSTVASPRWRISDREPRPWPVEAITRIRTWSLDNIERALPEPHAALAAGVLLGEQGSMPPSLTAALRTTGTTHLVVVSGQNVAIVSGVAVALLTAFLPRRRAGIVALLLLPAYVVLVGAGAPVLRGALMAVGIALAAARGRRTPAWVFLAYAAAAMLAVDPRLASDLSFQLSAAATAGVLLLAPPLTEVLVAPLVARPLTRGLLAGLVEAAVVSVAAAIAVLPVQASAFQTTSLVQVPANAAVALLYEGTLFVATLAVLLGWLAPVATLLHTAGALVPGAFIALVEATARVPVATVPLHLTPAFAVAWYAATAALLWSLHRNLRSASRARGLSTRARLPERRIALAAVAAGLWLVALAPVDDLASVTVLDVGQGLAILIRDRGTSVLVDTGPPDGAVLAALERTGHRGVLDVVVLTHDDSDHVGGTSEVLRRVGARRILAAPSVPYRLAGDIEPLDIADRIRVSDRTIVEVLAPAARSAPADVESDNDRGLVLMVTVGDRRILLPADIEAPAERWLAHSGQPLRADALVVAHHGSSTSSTAEFVHAVAPSLAVISVGARNPYGHPTAQVLARYADIPVHRTDHVGDVTLRSDGGRLWVRDAHAPAEGASPTPRATVAPRTTRTPTTTGR